MRLRSRSSFSVVMIHLSYHARSWTETDPSICFRMTQSSRRHGRGSRSPIAGDGWGDLLLEFGDATLPAPPIPLRLRSQLKRRSPWCWSTVPVDPMSMYLLKPAVSKRHASTEYAAVSHAGHGANSYGLNVYLVTETLAVFIQLSWGGVYSDRLES